MNTISAPAAPSAMSAADYLGPITTDLEEVERLLQRSLHNRHPRVAEVVDHIRHYRGKRLRPMLLLLSARACGRVAGAHITLSAVVEMIHTATLVHDDVLDGAQLRRRVATVNSLWGTKTSVLLGDYLFTHAFHLASSVDARACREIGSATDRVCEGELCQVLNAGNLELTEAEYFDIIDGKTAELTACCTKLGAIYAGASAETVEAMGRYGRWLGQAFQIADDLLDLLGQETLAGKSLGTDLDQGKLTLPLIHLLRSPLATRARTLLMSAEAHRRDGLRSLLEEAGSIEYARDVALNLASKAREELKGLPPSPSRSILEAMSERVVHRQA
ncbi:MAG: polyprenyl synthetase family protein [Gemmataceae bacterium]